MAQKGKEVLGWQECSVSMCAVQGSSWDLPTPISRGVLGQAGLERAVGNGAITTLSSSPQGRIPAPVGDATVVLEGSA